MPEMIKRLYRSKTNRMLFGICGGIGEYLNTDPTIIRVVWVLIALFTCGAALLAYLVCLFVIPEMN